MDNNKEYKLPNDKMDKKLSSDGIQEGITRRKALEKSALAIGACYLAPATLDLLLASRATAQSIIVGGLSGSSIGCVCNFTASAVEVTYLELPKSVCLEGDDTVTEWTDGRLDIPAFNLPEDENCQACCLLNSPVTVRTLGTEDVYFEVTPAAEILDQQVIAIMEGRMAVSDLANNALDYGTGTTFTFEIREDVKILVKEITIENPSTPPSPV